jgi:hypothetical protein
MSAASLEQALEVALCVGALTRAEHEQLSAELVALRAREHELRDQARRHTLALGKMAQYQAEAYAKRRSWFESIWAVLSNGRMS